jgi:hypothetical protein
VRVEAEELRRALGAVLEARIRLGLGEQTDDVVFLLEEAASEVERVQELLAGSGEGVEGGAGGGGGEERPADEDEPESAVGAPVVGVFPADFAEGAAVASALDRPVDADFAAPAVDGAEGLGFGAAAELGEGLAHLQQGAGEGGEGHEESEHGSDVTRVL